MKIIQPGHVYDVENIDGPGTQRIQFTERRGWDAELLPEDKRTPGIQSQELLRVLIDRTIYLHAEQAWHENVDIINHLRAALTLYESRAAHRHLEKLSMIERHLPCSKCGHLLCFCYPTIKETNDNPAKSN